MKIAPFWSHQVAGTKYVNKPLIVSKTDDYGIEGDLLELNCTVEADWSAKLEFKWDLPNKDIAKEVCLYTRNIESFPNVFVSFSKLWFMSRKIEWRLFHQFLKNTNRIMHCIRPPED